MSFQIFSRNKWWLKFETLCSDDKGTFWQILDQVPEPRTMQTSGTSETPMKSALAAGLGPVDVLRNTMPGKQPVGHLKLSRRPNGRSQKPQSQHRGHGAGDVLVVAPWGNLHPRHGYAGVASWMWRSKAHGLRHQASDLHGRGSRLRRQVQRFSIAVRTWSAGVRGKRRQEG